MTDQTIIRILEETQKPLSRMEHFEHCLFLVPSYNALLTSARANHPEEEFLRVLPLLDPEAKDKDGDPIINPRQLAILFAQLRIVLEGMVESAGGSGNAWSPTAEGGKSPFQPA
jgi:hypothetical protein